MEKIHTAVAHPWLCDMMGHMTTRHYVAIFDDASYFLLGRAFGWSGDEADGMGWADVRHEIDYQNEVASGTLLDVMATLERLGTKSITVRYEMRNARNQELVATLVSTSVRFDLTARKAVALTDEMRASAEPFLSRGGDA